MKEYYLESDDAGSYGLYFSLAQANARAKRDSRHGGGQAVVVRNKDTGKRVAEWYNGKREKSNPKRKKKATKRISAALTRFLKKQNPAKFKGVTQVRVRKLKDGGISITPLR